MSDALQWLRSIVEAATPGPWVYKAADPLDITDTWLRGKVMIRQEGKPRWVCEVPTEEIHKNGPAITTLHNLASEILAALEAAQRWSTSPSEPDSYRRATELDTALAALDLRVEEERA